MVSKKKLRYFIRDERKACKEYKKLGLGNLARDEKKHKAFLTMLLKHKKRK